MLELPGQIVLFIHPKAIFGLFHGARATRKKI
jgi:hypothetical protein